MSPTKRTESQHYAAAQAQAPISERKYQLPNRALTNHGVTAVTQRALTPQHTTFTLEALAAPAARLRLQNLPTEMRDGVFQQVLNGLDMSRTPLNEFNQILKTCRLLNIYHDSTFRNWLIARVRTAHAALPIGFQPDLTASTQKEFETCMAWLLADHETRLPGEPPFWAQNLWGTSVCFYIKLMKAYYAAPSYDIDPASVMPHDYKRFAAAIHSFEGFVRRVEERQVAFEGIIAGGVRLLREK